MKTKEILPKASNAPIENEKTFSKNPKNESFASEFDEEFDVNASNSSKKNPVKIVDEDPEWNERDIELEHPEEDLELPDTDFESEDTDDFESEDGDNNYYNNDGDRKADLEPPKKDN